MKKKQKIAVVLFNLGGPTDLKSVKQFLFNLFYDKAILSIPNPFRFLLAKLISSTRLKKSQEIYKKLGNKSPILDNTILQAKELERSLLSEESEYKVFIAMRYWIPFSKETLEKIQLYEPDQIVLLPLYPHFSTTTTKSSIDDFIKNFKQKKMNIPIKAIGCYPTDSNLIESFADEINSSIKTVEDKKEIKLLFSAHSLPEKVIREGDPYQWQIEQTAEEIVKKINIKELDWIVCYQSKVGPVKWLEPFTEDVIIESAQKNKIIVVVPIAFVSEHSETKVELDIDYKEIAKKNGAKDYIRIPALSINKHYIECLKNLTIELVNKKVKNKLYISSHIGKRYCKQKFNKCICDGEQ